MRSIAITLVTLILLAGCKPGTTSAKEQPERSIDSPSSTTPPVGEPLISTGTPSPKCFENDGLKYKVIINMSFTSHEEFNGNISVMEGKRLTDIQRFSGTLVGNIITAHFMGKHPNIGDASEWTDKPWTIKTVTGAQVLSIVFNAKNYETNKWEETTYEFKSCLVK